MIYWPRRFADIVLEDRTRQLQVICVVAAFGVAHWLWSYETPTNPATARAVFYFLSERQFALIVVSAGSLQLFAAAAPWWRLRLLSAIVKWTLWVYALVCYWLTSPDALAVPLLMTICVAELWIVLRAGHDRDGDKNGALSP